MIQESFNEVMKIKYKTVQRYRNIHFLKEYLLNIVGNHIKEFNDGYEFYKKYHVAVDSKSKQYVIIHYKLESPANLAVVTANNDNAAYDI